MSARVTKRFTRELFAGLHTPAEAARAAGYLDGWAGKHVYLPIENKQARRVQAARNMTGNGMADAAIVQALRDRFPVSCRTARRDVEAAHAPPIEVPSSDASGRALRVRRARALLDAGWTVADAVGSVQARFGVSLRSAQRDVKAAGQTPSTNGTADSDHSGF